jgi:hypothetical protein
MQQEKDKTETKNKIDLHIDLQICDYPNPKTRSVDVGYVIFIFFWPFFREFFLFRYYLRPGFFGSSSGVVREFFGVSSLIPEETPKEERRKQ